jgi:hypothetical protein
MSSALSCCKQLYHSALTLSDLHKNGLTSLSKKLAADCNSNTIRNTYELFGLPKICTSEYQFERGGKSWWGENRVNQSAILRGKALKANGKRSRSQSFDTIKENRKNVNPLSPPPPVHTELAEFCARAKKCV